MGLHFKCKSLINAHPHDVVSCHWIDPGDLFLWAKTVVIEVSPLLAWEGRRGRSYFFRRLIKESIHSSLFSSLCDGMLGKILLCNQARSRTKKKTDQPPCCVFVKVPSLLSFTVGRPLLHLLSQFFLLSVLPCITLTSTQAAKNKKKKKRRKIAAHAMLYWALRLLDQVVISKAWWGRRENFLCKNLLCAPYNLVSCIPFSHQSLLTCPSLFSWFRSRSVLHFHTGIGAAIQPHAAPDCERGGKRVMGECGEMDPLR